MPLVEELLIEYSPAETRAAALEDGRIVEFFHEPFGPRVGDIVRARVTAVDGPRAWVDLGGTMGLFSSPKSPLPTMGSAVLCQIRSDPGGDKAMAVSSTLEIRGRNVVLTPGESGAAVSRKISPPARRKELKAEIEKVLADVGEGVGAVALTSAAGVPSGGVAEELRTLLLRWRELSPTGPVGVVDGAPRLVDALKTRWPDAAIREDRTLRFFEEAGVEDALAAAAAAVVDLPGGGSLRIDETAALVAIDVNASGSALDAVQANLEAADETARQLRLRGLGGIILLDAIRMDDLAARDAILNRLRQAVEDLEPSVQVLGWTRGGLLEMTRTRLGPSLRERMGLGYDPARRPAAWGRKAVRHLIREALGRALSKPALRCAPGVAGWIDSDSSLKDRLQAVLGAPARIEPVPEWPLDRYEVLAEDNGQRERGSQ